MTPTHQDAAAALLKGTTLGRFSFGQDSFTLHFSRWAHQEAHGRHLPFDVALEAQGDISVHGAAASWEDLRSNYAGSAEALLASLLVQLCQSGDDAEVVRVRVDGPHLEILFLGGARVTVQARAGMMGPDWAIFDNPPGMPIPTLWSVFSEGGAVGSKLP